MSSNKFLYIKNHIIETLEEDLSFLSPIKRTLFDTLLDKIFVLFNEDCSDNDIYITVNSLSNVNTEYINPNDYISYDKAMEILNFGKNRIAFSNLMKIKGIKNKKVNNVHIGFPKSEIFDLASEIKEKRKKKEKKEVLKEKSEWKPSSFC